MAPPTLPPFSPSSTHSSASSSCVSSPVPASFPVFPHPPFAPLPTPLHPSPRKRTTRGDNGREQRGTSRRRTSFYSFSFTADLRVRQPRDIKREGRGKVPSPHPPPLCRRAPLPGFPGFGVACRGCASSSLGAG
ncbi:uncharacterized protein SCHCODRAFT_02619994 [Schizophyllum commune H4-8]|uniref:uncharacterized protein n=1 Tax=Schizophyllum commune (strain H4-8 / FGSC 9210) TaxID=578458 RepID=UPI00215F8C97|nr:uncharacterized protein SCHCODRAFT_02619994 [Schizophyllum commune H4-8]KAI5895647.1 hypothetical protein SCHCODRAFT_02619994 [Schizophyllum commune H4-8]